MAKRELDIVVISDVHLGTYGCQAKELLKYLKSIKPKMLVLNGDIIDIWQFSKRYWPESHMKVVRRILKFVADGTPVVYLTGNHDEMLRKFTDFEMGSLSLQNRLVLNLPTGKAWFFHGDVFDVTMKYSKWLAKLGAIGYDALILLNSFTNFLLRLMGREKYSFSKKIKNSVKGAVKFMNDFEMTAAEIAIDNDYQYVICGHIHTPEMKEIATENGKVVYLNSGDWVESLTALEYSNNTWEIYKYNPRDFSVPDDDLIEDEADIDNKLDMTILYENIVRHTGNR